MAISNQSFHHPRHVPTAAYFSRFREVGVVPVQPGEDVGDTLTLRNASIGIIKLFPSFGLPGLERSARLLAYGPITLLAV